MHSGRRFFAVVSVALASACSPAGVQDAGPSPTRRPASTTTELAPTSTSTSPAAVISTGTTPTSRAPATTTSVATTPPEAATTPATPAVWATCTNSERAYSIGHPAGWHTASGCRYFDPAPLDIPPQTDGFFSAIVAVDSDTTFEEARRRSDNRVVVIVSRAEATVGDRRAVRYETEATGEGLFEKGTRLYSFVVDRAGQSFEVITAWFPGTSTAEYQGRKNMVDAMVATVRFL